MAAVAMSQSSFMTPAASKAKSCVASVFAILDQKSRIDPNDESGMALEEVKGEIEYSHVSFKYPTRPNVLVLKDFSLTIQAGEVTSKGIIMFVWTTFVNEETKCLIMVMEIRQLL